MNHTCLYFPAAEHHHTFWLVLISRPAEGRRLSWNNVRLNLPSPNMKSLSFRSGAARSLCEKQVSSQFSAVQRRATVAGNSFSDSCAVNSPAKNTDVADANDILLIKKNKSTAS